MYRFSWTALRYALLLLVQLALLVLPAGPASAREAPAQDPLAILMAWEGEVEAIGPARWIIGGQLVDVMDATVIENEGVTLPGMWASVEAAWQQDRFTKAVRVVTMAQPDMAVPVVELIGPIYKVDPHYWLVGKTRIVITSATKVVGTAQEGGTAFVKAQRVDDMLLGLAMVAIPPDAGELAFLEGELLGFDETLWYVDVGGQAHVVNIGTDTLIEGQVGAGSWVEVIATREDQGLKGWYAAIKDPALAPVRLAGKLLLQVATTTPQQWVVLLPGTGDQLWRTETLLVDPASTLIDESGGPLVTGAWITAEAEPPQDPDSHWMARSVRFMQAFPRQVQGDVKSIDERSMPDIWQVGNLTVLVDEAALIEGRPRVGRHAFVNAVELGDNVYWATAVKMRYRFHGTVVSRNDGARPRLWTLEVSPENLLEATGSKVLVLIDDDARVEPSVEQAGLGAQVEVFARATSAGWMAQTVRLADSLALPVGLDS